MTVDASSLLTISIGTIVALIGVVIAATATWTRVVVRLDALAASLRELRSWHLRATESAGKDLDEAVESWRHRWHTSANRMQTIENRIYRLEHHVAIPHPLESDHTPTPVEVPTARHRRVQPRAEDSST